MKPITGSATYTVDEKGRFSLRPEWVKRLEVPFYVIPLPGGLLRAISGQAWEEMGRPAVSERCWPYGSRRRVNVRTELREHAGLAPFGLVRVVAEGDTLLIGLPEAVKHQIDPQAREIARLRAVVARLEQENATLRGRVFCPMTALQRARNGCIANLRTVGRAGSGIEVLA